MPRQCSVISCKSSEKKSVTLFKIRASNFDSWNNIIRKVNGNKKRKVTYVCAAHFTDEDLITTYSGPPDLDLIKALGKRELTGLKKGAIPSVFDPPIDLSDNNSDTIFGSEFHDGKILSFSPEQICSSIGSETGDGKKLPVESIRVQICTPPSLQDSITKFKDILSPVGWMLYCDTNLITLYKPNKTGSDDIKLVVEKQIVFQSNPSDIRYYVYQKLIDPSIVSPVELNFPLDMIKVAENVRLFEHKTICLGGPNVMDFPGIHVKNTQLENKIWRHDKCSILTNAKKRCERCKSLFPYFKVCKRRIIARVEKYGSPLTPTKHDMKSMPLKETKMNKK